jgi:hypothetical protein
MRPPTAAGRGSPWTRTAAGPGAQRNWMRSHEDSSRSKPITMFKATRRPTDSSTPPPHPATKATAQESDSRASPIPKSDSRSRRLLGRRTPWHRRCNWYMGVPDDTASNALSRPLEARARASAAELLRKPDRVVTRREAADLSGIILDTVDPRLRVERVTVERRGAPGRAGCRASSSSVATSRPPEQLDAEIVADHLADTSRDNGVGGFQFGCAGEVHP